MISSRSESQFRGDGVSIEYYRVMFQRCWKYRVCLRNMIPDITVNRSKTPLNVWFRHKQGAVMCLRHPLKFIATQKMS